MGNFVIKTQTNNATYEYTDNNIIVQGNFVKDITTTAVISISGTCYAKDGQGNQGEYIGNFNGYMREEEIRYTISEMSRRDSTMVMAAIDEIEAAILGENVQEVQA